MKPLTFKNYVTSKWKRLTILIVLYTILLTVFFENDDFTGLIDLSEKVDDISKKEEYIDDNTFIISEHANIFKELKKINDIHIGIEKCNENINFDDLPFKFKFKYLLKQFEDIEMKCNELNIKIYYDYM